MHKSLKIIMATGLVVAFAGLSGCGKKGESDTNVVEMNASDGSMNDMTVVESATLDQADGAAADNSVETGNASNAL